MNTLHEEVNAILVLSEQKEYTLLPTALINHLLADNRLIKGATSLWQILFNFAKGNKKLIATVRYRRLAELLGKSTKTIGRYVQNLKEMGYLIIQPNYRDNGGKTVNTFYLRIPPEILSQLQKTPDRRKTKTDKNGEVEKSNIITAPNDEIMPAQSAENVLRETIGPIDYSNKNILQDANNALENITGHRYEQIKNTNTTSTPVQENINLDLPDKTVQSPPHKSVLRNNTKDNVILNNNNTVVVDENNKNINGCLNKTHVNKQDIESYQQHIKTIEIEINQLQTDEHQLLIQAQGKNASEHLALFQQRRHLTQKINTLISQKEMYHSLLKQQSKEQESHEQFEAQLLSTGPRQLMPHHLSRLEKTLQPFIIHHEKHQQIRQEIIYAVRFGSLVSSCKTKQPMSIEHSLNIALKLIKEGRWETPVEMKRRLNG